MYKVTFDTYDQSIYSKLTNRYPKLIIRQWSLPKHQVVEFVGGSDSSGQVLEQIREHENILSSTIMGDGFYAVSTSTPKDTSIQEKFRHHNCVYVPPTVYQYGSKKYSVVGFERQDIHALLQDLKQTRDITVRLKFPMETLSLPSEMPFTAETVFKDLTSRQIEAIQIALENGYYNQPRKATVKELANHTTVARATYEEHLRKAENKIMINIKQYVTELTDIELERKLRPLPDESSIAVNSD